MTLLEVPEFIGTLLDISYPIVYSNLGAEKTDCIAITLSTTNESDEGHKATMFLGSYEPIIYPTLLITCRSSKYSAAMPVCTDIWNTLARGVHRDSVDIIPVNGFKYVGRDEKMLHIFRATYKIIYKGE